MAKIFFHVGLHKTATTWFQRQFFPRLENVHVLRTRQLDTIALPADDSPTLIVSHEGLSGTISDLKTPGAPTARLSYSLKVMKRVAPNSAVLIGFREHKSWLQSAFRQRLAKNPNITQEDYVSLFSPEDLSWCLKMQMIEACYPTVFPFLYEELLLWPNLLVGDLCRFIGKPPPGNLDTLLGRRENPSPRSHFGRLMSRSLLSLVPPSRRKRATSLANRVGAWLDGSSSHHWEKDSLDIVLPPDLKHRLSLDWKSALVRIGEHRCRDFSELAAEEED